MAFGDALNDYQWRYINGTRTLTFGDGTDYDVLSQSGLDGSDVRDGDLALPRGHGAVPGKHFLPARQPVFRLEVLSSSQELWEAARQTWLDALTVSEDDVGTLELKRPGQSQRFLRVRPLATDWPTEASGIGLAGEPRVGFSAADPRLYGVTGRQASLDIFNASGGLDYGVDYGKDFTSGAGGDVEVSNAGNADAYPLIRVHGPTSGTCTGVQITNRTSGVEIDVQTNLTAGQILTIDMGLVVTRIASEGNEAGLEVHLGGSSRYGSWQQTRAPLALQPGSSVLRFTADGTTTGMSAVATWRDTWL